MRDSVVVAGIRYYRSELTAMRSCAVGCRLRARENVEVAVNVEQRIREVETALDAPEPLVAGDIVENIDTPKKRFMVLDEGGDIKRLIAHTYPWAKNTLVLTDGVSSFPGMPEKDYRRVGNIQEVK